MSQTLYRKWRPQTFGELRGQDRIRRTLLNALASGRLGHAYLFTGPRGVGKTTTARLLAKAVNCLHDQAPIDPSDPSQLEPDNSCNICVEINEGRSFDVIEIDAASNGRVDDARELRSEINMGAPFQARKKFYIIDEVHQMTKDAFDALLKTFEEPPEHVVFVLATTDVNKVPPTILSRCQRFDFRRHSVIDLRAGLTDVVAKEGVTAEPSALELLARASDGSSRDSLSLLDQAIAFSGQNITEKTVRDMLGLASSETIDQLADALHAHDARAGLEIINQASQAGVDPRTLNRELIEHLRNLLLLKVGGGQAGAVELTQESVDALHDRALASDEDILVEQIRLFSEADYALRSAFQAQLPLELAFLQALDVRRRATPQGFGEPASPVPARPAAAPAPPRPVPAAAAPRPEPPVKPAPVPAPAKPAPAPAALESAPAPPASEPEPEQLYQPPASPPEPMVAAEQPAPAPVADGSANEMPAGDLTLDVILSSWPKVIDLVQGQQRNVAALMRSCSPVDVTGSTVTLQCDSPFHAQKLEEQGNLKMVEGAFAKVTGRPCYVKCVVKDKKAPAAGPDPSAGSGTEPKDEDPLVRAALRMLNARALE